MLAVAVVVVVTLLVLAIGYGVLRKDVGDPERTVRSWRTGSVERFYAIAGSPEHMIYIEVVAEPDPVRRAQLVEALSRPAPNDLRSRQRRVVEDSLIEAVAAWARGRPPTEIQDAASSETLIDACKTPAEAAGLRVVTLKVLEVAPFDEALRNLAQWRVNGAYYDRGDGKMRSDNINAAVVQLDAQGVGQIMVNSRPKRGNATYRLSTEVVDNPDLTVEVFAQSGRSGHSYRSFDEMRRDERTGR